MKTQKEKIIEKLNLKETDKTFGVSFLNGKVYEYLTGLYLFFGNREGERTNDDTCIMFKADPCINIVLSLTFLLDVSIDVITEEINEIISTKLTRQ